MVHQAELTEHRRYLQDSRKLDAYRDALAEILKPGQSVLDLGAGTGILGLLACEAGADSVIAVDRGAIIDLAREIAASNRLSDRITHVRALSTELQLEDPVDVIVCDQIGGAVHDAGILSCYADAHRRLLAPGGRLIPASFTLFVAPVSFDSGRSAVDFWLDELTPFDISAGHRLAINTEWRFHVDPPDVVALAPGGEIAAFPSHHDDAIEGELTFTSEAAGRLDGFIVWFVARLSPSVTLTNNPWDAGRFDRFCNFYPTEEALDLASGDRVTFRIDVRPRLGVTGWRTTVVSRDGSERAMHQSTFALRPTEEFSKQLHPVARTDDVERAIKILEMIDGSRTVTEISTALEESIGPMFASKSHIDRFVSALTDLVR